MAAGSLAACPALEGFLQEAPAALGCCPLPAPSEKAAAALPGRQGGLCISQQLSAFPSDSGELLSAPGTSPVCTWMCVWMCTDTHWLCVVMPLKHTLISAWFIFIE